MAKVWESSGNSIHRGLGGQRGLGSALWGQGIWGFGVRGFGVRGLATGDLGLSWMDLGLPRHVFGLDVRFLGCHPPHDRDSLAAAVVEGHVPHRGSREGLRLSQVGFWGGFEVFGVNFRFLGSHPPHDRDALAVAVVEGRVPQ